MKNSALVVIDLQNDITKHYREIIDPVNAAIDWAVQKELWVIYIQHNNLSAGTRTFKPGTRGAELVSELNVVSGHIFTKSKSNALTSEAFAAFIQEHGISEFYIVGADAASASCRSDPAHGRIYPDSDTDASAEYGAGVTHASWTARIQEQYERLLPDFSSDTGWRVSLAPDGTLALTALDPEHGASIYYAHDVMLEPMIFRSVDLPIGTN